MSVSITVEPRQVQRSESSSAPLTRCRMDGAGSVRATSRAVSSWSSASASAAARRCSSDAEVRAVWRSAGRSALSRTASAATWAIELRRERQGGSLKQAGDVRRCPDRHVPVGCKALEAIVSAGLRQRSARASTSATSLRTQGSGSRVIPPEDRTAQTASAAPAVRAADRDIRILRSGPRAMRGRPRQAGYCQSSATASRTSGDLLRGERRQQLGQIRVHDMAGNPGRRALPARCPAGSSARPRKLLEVLLRQPGGGGEHRGIVIRSKRLEQRWPARGPGLTRAKRATAVAPYQHAGVSESPGARVASSSSVSSRSPHRGQRGGRGPRALDPPRTIWSSASRLWLTLEGAEAADQANPFASVEHAPSRPGPATSGPPRSSGAPSARSSRWRAGDSLPAEQPVAGVPLESLPQEARAPRSGPASPPPGPRCSAGRTPRRRAPPRRARWPARPAGTRQRAPPRLRGPAAVPMASAARSRTSAEDRPPARRASFARACSPSTRAHGIDRSWH